MKNRHCFFLLLALLVAFCGCKKIVIPEEEDGGGSSVHTDEPIDFRGHSTLEEYLTEYGTDKQPIPCEDLLPNGCVYRSIMEQGTLSLVQDCWVEGIVVGTVDGSVMKQTVFGTAGLTESNIVLASTVSENNYERCLPVQLSNGSKEQKAVREELNLALNPDNLGLNVAVKGKISKYLGTIGVKSTESVLYGYESPDDDPADPSEQDDDEDVNFLDLFSYLQVYGSEERPIPVNHLLEGHFLFNELAKGKETITSAWVKGYVVGYLSSSSMNFAVFGTEDASDTNVILAGSPDETDFSRCIPVKLTNSYGGQTSVRAQLNLKDHPEYYKKEICIAGKIDWYMHVVGLVAPYAFNVCSAE